MILDPSAINAVLLEEVGWVNVSEVQLMSVTSPAKWPNALGMRDAQTRMYLYVPLSSVLGYRTRDRVRSAEEVAEEAAEKQARADRLFERQHYATREVYEAASAAQNGLCAAEKCRMRLKQSPITHFNEGKVYCQYHTPLQHRYGEA